MKTFGKLREAIKKKYKTMAAFADALGIDRSTFSLKINGKVGWKNTEIEAVCNLLEIPMASVSEYFFYE